MATGPPSRLVRDPPGDTPDGWRSGGVVEVEAGAVTSPSLEAGVVGTRLGTVVRLGWRSGAVVGGAVVGGDLRGGAVVGGAVVGGAVVGGAVVGGGLVAVPPTTMRSSGLLVPSRLV
ncbi:MAG: hypothetical protein ACRDZX_13740 [Acidimicrobiales bacterium]